MVIGGAVNKSGGPLTIRDALIQIGTEMGRGMSSSVWIDAFDFKYNKLIQKQYEAVIVSDLRFIDEFDYLSYNKFFIVKIKRDSANKIDNISETQQNLIPDDKFSFILDNNSDLDTLQRIITNQLYPVLKQHFDK